MSRIVVISALQSELAPLVKGWSRESVNVGEKPVQCFMRDNVIAAAGGIGASRAEKTAQTLVERYQPEFLVSAGLAGALTDNWKTGSIVVPEAVVDAETGAEYRCERAPDAVSHAVLVTAPNVSGKDAKAALAQKFGASIVDMEAAGVARVAREKGIAFRCVKAISDERAFPMPPLGRFVRQGEFHTAAFLRWLAFHPQYWGLTIVLGRNSSRASRALCDWLRRNVSPQVQAAELLH